jgi:hypothetical protein
MQKPKSLRPWQPDLSTALPASPREWLADDYQLYFLLDLVDEKAHSSSAGLRKKTLRELKSCDARCRVRTSDILLVRQALYR